MNLLVSYDWLKEYVSLKETPEEFATRISLSGPSVEKIFPQGEDLKNIVVGKVLKLEPHPQADKLQLVTVDIGKHPLAKEGRGDLRLVCGGINLYESQLVAVALIGAKVRWHGQGDPIVLEAAEIRGIKSEGMICAADEIGLGEAFPAPEKEILDLQLDPSLSPLFEKGRTGSGVKPGAPLADLLGLSGDVVMDVEVTSNRPDCMGMIGIALEASAIMKRPFIWKIPKMPKAGGKGGVSVIIDAKTACSRYMGARITGVKVKQSPWWLKRRLMSAGIRPINNLVDITNYVMLEIGQPMHVFDTAKLKAPAIHIRFARAGEKIQALDSKTYELNDKILVIADTKDPIAIAGVMGGEQTGADANTTDIVLEAATFDPVIVRKGSRKLLLQSDSQLRFEKGLSQMAPPAAMARAIELVLKLAGGKLAGAPVDAMPKAYKPAKYSISVDEVNALIGIEVKRTEMVAILKRLGFEVSGTAKVINVTVPYWRDHDIESGRDLVEEIARVIGYSKIPSVVPIALAPRESDQEIQWENRLKDFFKAAGYTEIYSYSFVSKDLLKKACFDPEALLKVQNPLSTDLEVMRPSLIPQMLEALASNQERESSLRLFEASRIYVRKDVVRGTSDVGRSWKDLPDEVPQVCISLMDKKLQEPWKHIKGLFEHLLDNYGVQEVHWKRVTRDPLWHPGRTAQAFVKDELIATVGEIHPSMQEKFKLDSSVGAIELELRNFEKVARLQKSYVPPQPFPPSKRDLAIIVAQDVEFRDIQVAIQKADERIQDVEWFDTYTGKGMPAGKKSVAMHLTIGSKDKTLDSNEIDGVVNDAILACKEKFKAEVRA
ncbi:MAG: phenylalanine--tRNA ligase subunit beta [Patescibacteria group bacterium]|jgi:phenylalanyl-tRNA synthetase beta chain